MIVQRFVKWCETANSRQRAEGVSILARAFVEARIPDGEWNAARSALTLVLDDPSPKVRLVLGEILAPSPLTPRPIALSLCEDTDDIACAVARLSPVLSDADLIDLAATGSTAVQAAIAGRSDVSVGLAAALAEIGSGEAVVALLCNPGASIAPISHRRIAERHGGLADVRSLMLDRSDVPVDVRQMLILHLGSALGASPLVAGLLGKRRADRLVFDACERATAMIAADVEPAELPALVQHLRLSGQLSTALLIRVVCGGNIDLFAAALVALSGMSERRVRAIVVDGREAAFHALVGACGLPPAAAPVLRAAVLAWKEVVSRHRSTNVHATEADIVARLVENLETGKRGDDGHAVAALLNRLSAETLRGSARAEARRMAA